VKIDDLCDDDVQRERGKLYGQPNMLARKLHMCTPKTYCTPLYTTHLWCNFNELKNILVSKKKKSVL